MKTRYSILTSAALLLMVCSLSIPFTANSSVSDHYTPPAQIAAAPARINVDISKGRPGGSIRVFNLGTEAVTVSTAINHWHMDRNNKVEVIAPTSQSLDQWLIVNPINFTIAPGKHQVVRYSVRPRVTPHDGEHRAMIFFNQVRNSTDAGTIDVNFRLGVAVYGNAGRVSRVGKLHDIAVRYQNNAAQLATDIESLGNANVRMEGQISIWPKSRYPGPSSVGLFDLSEGGWDAPQSVVAAALLSASPVLPGSRRVLNSSVELPRKPGRYIAHVQAKLGDKPIIKALPFTIP